MSHTSSSSSLLQQNRPEALLPQLPTDPSVALTHAQAQWLEQHEHTQQQLCRSKGSDTRLARSNESHSVYSSSQSAASGSGFDSTCLQPVASTSSGLNYLNTEPTACPSIDHAVADLPSPYSDGCSENIQKCANILATVNVSAIGEAMSREKWQPDEESTLCTYPLCTANFAQPTYFFLGPRRHHCRLCGLLFCSAHSAQRAPLIHSDGTGKRTMVRDRVCDLCLPKPDTEADVLPRSTQHSRRNSSATESEADLVTPCSDDGHPLAGSALLRASSRITLDRHTLKGSPTGDANLAPIEPWMDRSGVLSLYPLAVNASHSRTRRSLSPAPSAAPLFAPSIEARRTAKEKELERLTLRQRRMGQESEFWLPGKWGYKREDFDPSFFRDGEEDEDQYEKEVGGMVEDGPIRFRTGVRKVTTPGVTPMASRS
ncbi:hypothetical protein CI109_106964 [Kwoniella shandongensis]|uniref:Uncharacterized protein n=1 Tax=Kwoniella shandongensis TaxID=1734106 RepID=A0A5M6C648_9TREE|nr:uncharacterized protein CI109_000782 [Kwoniella shandongensis]KAA5530604.1 hypothetical protein CI109_000782 [Kwoniella shandongensis]